VIERLRDSDRKVVARDEDLAVAFVVLRRNSAAITMLVEL
jgi:hypothetical protein